MHGIVGVSDHISLRSRVNTANISNDISCAHCMVRFTNPDAITVTAEGGRLPDRKRQTVWHARQVAAQTAWGAPGTSDVENLLVVV